MNPSMIQAIAAHRSTELREQAAAWRRAGRNRRPRPGRRPWVSARIAGAGRGAPSLREA
jgi:hypothetical protein